MKDSITAYQKVIKENQLLKQKIQNLKITQKNFKKIEKALMASELKYQTVFERTDTALLIVDADMMITHANKISSKLTGYTREEMEGKKKWTELIKKNDLKKIIARNTFKERKRETKAISCGVRLTGKDGQIKNISLNMDIIPGTKSSVVCLADITDGKRTEKNLKPSQSEFSSIIEFLPDATFVIDLQGKVIAWNKAMEEMTGVPKKDMLGLGNHAYTVPFYGKRQQHLMDLLDKDSPSLASKYQHVQKKRNTVYAEAFAPSLFGGKGAHIFITAAPLFDNQGQRIGTIESIRDLTDYRQAEANLKEANRRLDQIIEALPDATLVIDTEGKVIAWNRAMEQMTGIKASKILGMNNYEYALPFYGERRPILIDLVMHPQKEFEKSYLSTQGGDTVLYGEAYMPALKGGEVFLSGKASVLKNSKGEVAGAIESIRDITARKKAEEKYKGIFDNAVMGIFQATPEGKLMSANPAFARVLGYDSPEEILNIITDISRQLTVNPQHLHRLLQIIDKEGVIESQEMQLLRKDGNPVWVYASGRSISDGRGKLLYYEGTIQDITDRRRLESQLRQAQKMEAIGALAGGISHDFNNILASIMGFTEMAAKEDRHEIRNKYIDRVLQSCARAKDLINHILSFSRQQEQERRPVDVKLMIEEALSLIRATLPSTIEIKQELPPEQSIILADSTQMHQILINLCTNAAHAMREKGGLLEIKTSNIELSGYSTTLNSYLKPGSYVKLTVRDTGQGIDPAIKDKIFDPFFTTKVSKEGTGLGLSVVYGIVKGYGGDIDVESIPGQGATFMIYFPRIHQDRYTEKVSVQKIDVKGNERILFVDDEPSLVMLAQAYFESMGYQITTKIKSLDALKLFREKPQAVDLLITDMTMPDMKGTELACEVLKIRPDLPVILCTGYSDSVNADLCREMNIRELVIKPFSLQDLGILVRRTLNR